MPNRVIYFLKELCEIAEPGKKAVQKLVYLTERKGVDLGMDYYIHYYGPYSSELDQCLHSLEAKDIVSIDTSGMTHKLKVKCEPETNPFTARENTLIADVLLKFAQKTPLELEVLTTTDYVATSLLPEDNPSDEAILKTVTQIKGEKFSKKQIQDSINFLRCNGFIA